MKPNRFNLWRIAVEDTDGDEFERRLRWYMALDRPWSWLTTLGARLRPVKAGSGIAPADNGT
jgi:hypothetical protein